MFTIELTSGSSWNESIKTIDSRKCDTISAAYAAAEGLHWLLETQKFWLARGVTHYRVIQHDEAITGGPFSPRETSRRNLRSGNGEQSFLVAEMPEEDARAMAARRLGRSWLEPPEYRRAKVRKRRILLKN